MTTTYGGPRKQATRNKATISASALRGLVTGGAGDGSQLPERRLISAVTVDYIAFDPSTEETAFFQWSPPDDWDKGPFTFVCKWTAASGSGAVVWGLSCTGFGDGASVILAGPEVTVTDTLDAADDVMVSPESGLMQPGEVPDLGNRPIVFFEIARKATDSADTLAVDAQLLELTLYYRRGVAAPLA